jgi:hypothetical protein
VTTSAAAATSNPPSAGPARTLKFETNAEIVRELNRLRHGGYAKRANWSLQQMCYHISVPLKKRIKPPATTTPTAEQAAMYKMIIEPILATGKPPPGMQPPPEMIPPAQCDDAAIDEFIALLDQLDKYPHEYVDFGAMGPVKTDVLRQITKYHAAHHLAFLDPKHARRDLSFANEDEVIADVEKLRRGHVRLGGWTLEQICWHLEQGVRYRMAPPPHPANTPEQNARAGVLKQVLASGKLPGNIIAPDPMVPPKNVGPEAIDSFIQSMREFKAFPGPIAPHRVFGKIEPESDARRVNLIHCAHHLSYLVPTAS